MDAIKGGTGMAQPEQRIYGVTDKYGGCMGEGPVVSTIPCVIGHGGSWVCAGAWLLVMIVTSLEE